MAKPKLLDLCCGAGGAAMGYHRAGFDVVGVDLVPQPHYPFKFYRLDAVAFARLYAGDFAAVHASPPCQRHTAITKGTNAAKHAAYPELIAPIREQLKLAGAPYIIENAVSAPLVSPVMLCGIMFGLRVIRHRLFECSWPADAPAHIEHDDLTGNWRHGKANRGRYFAVYGTGGSRGTLAQWRAAMGIGWMTKAELREAIPPAYTKYLGQQLLHQVVAA